MINTFQGGSMIKSHTSNLHPLPLLKKKFIFTSKIKTMAVSKVQT